MIITGHIQLSTRGNTDCVDITGNCRSILSNSGLKNGTITVFNPGSTGGITTIEFEPNLVKDLKESLEVLAPADKVYEHQKTWHDDNGSSHIRSAVIGPSLTIPFVGGELTLGTWQQIVFCDFDTRPRERELVVQVTGE